MAKKKKRRNSRNKRAKRSVKSDKASPLGASGGLVLTGAEMVFIGPTDTAWSPFMAVKAGDYKGALDLLKRNAMTPDKYMPVLAGMLVSASPKIPLVRIIAKPLDETVRRASKGKVSM